MPCAWPAKSQAFAAPPFSANPFTRWSKIASIFPTFRLKVGGRPSPLVGADIAKFENGNRYNHEPKRTRKLLLHRSEIDELLGKTKSKGLTIVPLRLYLTSKGRAKLELGLARGKQLHDRRRDIADRDSRRDIAREMADAQRGR